MGRNAFKIRDNQLFRIHHRWQNIHLKKGYREDIAWRRQCSSCRAGVLDDFWIVHLSGSFPD